MFASRERELGKKETQKRRQREKEEENGGTRGGYTFSYEVTVNSSMSEYNPSTRRRMKSKTWKGTKRRSLRKENIVTHSYIPDTTLLMYEKCRDIRMVSWKIQTSVEVSNSEMKQEMLNTHAKRMK